MPLLSPSMAARTSQNSQSSQDLSLADLVRDMAHFQARTGALALGLKSRTGQLSNADQYRSRASQSAREWDAGSSHIHLAQPHLGSANCHDFGILLAGEG